MPSYHSAGAFQGVVRGLDHIALSDDELVVLLLFGIVVGELSLYGLDDVFAFGYFWLYEFVCVDFCGGVAFLLLGAVADLPALESATQLFGLV